MTQEYCVSVILRFDYQWKGKVKQQEINPQLYQGAIVFMEKKPRSGGEEIGGLTISGYCLHDQARRSFFFSRIMSRIEVIEVGQNS